MIEDLWAKCEKVMESKRLDAEEGVRYEVIRSDTGWSNFLSKGD